MKFYLSIWCLLTVTCSLAGTPHEPDFGVIINDDSDLAFICPDPVKSEALLRTNVSGLAGSAVGTLVYCVGSGSDTLNYPTKVASTVGWRHTKYEEENATWRKRMENARACMAAGMDPIRIVGKQAKEIGLYFLPSLRMNDAHFIFDPFNYPLTGEFWIKNHATLTIGDSPLTFRKGYENLLDYSKSEVSEYRLKVIAEVIERYEDLIDGFELDFNRVQVFFPKGKAQERAHLITDMLREVRKMLEEASQRQGRPMYLFARIPPSLPDCQWAGLDVETWMNEGLVDLVSPAQLMTLAQDMPIEDMIEYAHQNNVLVYPSLYPRTAWRTPLDPESPTQETTTILEREATLAEILGAASAYYAQGAEGFYLFNFYNVEEARRPYPDWFYAMTRALATPSALDGASMVYFVTQTFYNDDKDPTYAYHKQIPASLGKEAAEFTLSLGKAPADSAFPVKNCVLRIGGQGTGSKVMPIVEINNHQLDASGENATSFNLEDAKDRKRKQAAETYWVLPINKPSILLAGENQISVTWPDTTVTDIEIGLSYHRHLSRLWLREETPLNATPEE